MDLCAPAGGVVDLANNELRNDAGTFVDVQRFTSGTTVGPV
jgi:hypothetical protein